MLRLDPGLHAALREAARAEDVSLNEYCARKLAAPTGSLAPAGAAAVMRRAASCFGADLLAVVAFGSWARGEAADGSDVDLLIVVDGRVELERELYRRWDDQAQDLARDGDGRAIDIHIAHLPDADRFSPSVWGEVAIDGIVLFERDLVLSRRLAEIRRLLLAGDVVRRMTAIGADALLRRAETRVRAIDALFDAESWADVVRESQEALELALKGLLRACGVDPPRAHDVSDVLIAERDRLPEALRSHVDELAAASRDLRRDRELAFYGAEDLTPTSFYTKQDAKRARDAVRSAVRAIAPIVLD